MFLKSQYETDRNFHSSSNALSLINNILFNISLISISMNISLS